MDRREYELLQERFSKLLSKKPYGRANEKEAYRSGVLAAKSVLKDVYEHSENSDSTVNPYCCMEQEGRNMSELKPCPCNDCPIRQSYAMRFHIHVWGENCPRKCEEFEEWRAET